MCHNVAWDTTVLIHQSFFYILMFFSQATQKVHSEMWHVCIALLCRHVIAFSPIVKFFGIWTCLFNCCICLFGTWVSCNAWVVLILKKWSWIMVWQWWTSRKVGCLPVCLSDLYQHTMATRASCRTNREGNSHNFIQRFSNKNSEWQPTWFVSRGTLVDNF